MLPSNVGAPRSSMKYRSTKRILTNAMSRMLMPATTWLFDIPRVWCPPSDQDSSVAKVSPSQTALVLVRSGGASVVIAASIHQVEKREQDDPQQVDQVPVAAGAFEPAELLGVQHRATCGEAHVGQRRQAEQQVEPVQTGEYEVEHVEAVGRRCDAHVDLARVLHNFQHGECQTADDCSGHQR